MDHSDRMNAKGTAKETSGDVSRDLEQVVRWHERNRRLLAYEIHDGFVQEATAAQMHLQMLIETDRLPPGPEREEVRLAHHLIRKAIDEARQLVAGLQPQVLDEMGAVAAIDALLKSQPEGGPAIRFIPNIQFDRLDPLLERTLYRIIQEGITNARRHSESDRVEVRLTEASEHLEVEIRDWGVGFDPAAVPKDRHGLQGIRERARLLHGRVVIMSNSGNGTRIRVELPIVPQWEQWQGTAANMNDRSYE